MSAKFAQSALIIPSSRRPGSMTTRRRQMISSAGMPAAVIDPGSAKRLPSRQLIKVVFHSGAVKATVWHP